MVAKLRLLVRNFMQILEHYYNEDPRENDSIEYKYFMNFVKEHNLTPYRTEWNVYDEELEMAGSIDMIFEADGTYYL